MNAIGTSAPAMDFPDVVLSNPSWIGEVARPGDCYPTATSRMDLAVRLAAENVRRGGGGPFGAAVFHVADGRLIAPGVNRVVPLGCSLAHAELIAIAVAQRRLGTYDLGGGSVPPCELVSSVEPCAMCLGAIPWSGIRRLVCGATAADAQAIGFDEGPRPPDWVARLAERGIEVEREMLRDGARAVLLDYATRGGEIYNGRSGTRRAALTS